MGVRSRRLPGLSRYEIREDGQVVSHWRKNPRVLRGGTVDGYRKFVLINDDGERVHRRRAGLVCTAFHGPRPSGKVVRHKDGSRTNDSAGNLSWATQAENVADKWKHGTAQVGDRCNLCKLTEDDVREIRRLLAVPSSRLAARFGVTRDAIKKIRSRKNWAWLP